MKVALLADIHGNAGALDAVLHAARAAGAARLLVAGDLVGYYYAPRRVLELLDDWQWDCVRGNHEDMLKSWRRDEDRERIRRKYGSGLEIACEQLNSDALDMLESLPHPLTLEVAGESATICHGAPWDLDEYVYPDAPEEKSTLLAGHGGALVVYGHTHYPVVWRVDGTIVVNPGSVGQARDRIPGACWAMWDTDDGSVVLGRETYDVSEVRAEARRRDPALPYLADVLTRTH